MCAHLCVIMKQKTILLLAVLCGMLTSCFDDEEVTYDDYCYISNVSLGQIKRQIWTLDTLGNRVKAYTSYSGSSIQMTIDQRDNTIQNRDSLLYGSDLSAVLVTITYDGLSLVYRPANDSTAEWKSYNSKDSIDLRQPLHLLAIANDGASNRIYTLKVNVHRQEGDSLYWTRQDSAVTQLQDMQVSRAVVQGDMLHVLGYVDQQVCVASRSLLGTSAEWTRTDTHLPQDAQVGTLCQLNDKLYVGTASGNLYCSDDAALWQRVSTIGQNARLAGAGKSFLYAVDGTSLMRSADGQIWEQEQLDDDARFLPDTCITLLTFDGEDGDSRVVMVGYRAHENDTTAMVWNKTWSSNGQEDSSEWIFFTQTRENKWFCPRLESLNVMAYDDRCLAFGGASAYEGGKHEAMCDMFFSRDYGITWKPDYELHLPNELRGVSGPVASAVDGEHYIWIIANHEVWRGRLNRLGFLRP